MPEFQRDPIGLEDYLQGQQDHYMKNSSHPDRLNQRPAETTTSQSWTVVTMKDGRPQIARKEVPKTNAGPAPRSQSPAQTPAAGVPQRKPVSSANRSPAPSTSQSRSRERIPLVVHEYKPPVDDTDPYGSQQGYAVPTPAVYPGGFGYPRPGSQATSRTRRDSNSSKPSIKRTDSNTSVSSWMSKRRSSVSKMARRMSDTLQSAVAAPLKIIAMDSKERQIYARDKKNRAESELEEQRRRDPLSRPEHQRESLVARQRAKWQGNPDENPIVSDSPSLAYDNLVKDKAFHARYNAEYRQRWAEETAERASRGEPPRTPPSEFSEEDLDMSPEFREESRDSLKARPSDIARELQAGKLDKTEQFAMSLSQNLDMLKLRRQRTVNSDMSIGMTDQAPAEAMNRCEGCDSKTTDYLVNGKCELCRKADKKLAKDKAKLAMLGDEYDGFFTDPFQFPQGRATWPDTGSPEHGYIHLPKQKRLLRIRQTIYEDPGNPFADELETESPESEMVAPFDKSLPPPPPPAKFDFDGPEQDEETTEMVLPPTPRRSITMPEAVMDPILHSQDRSSIRRALGRSKSVAVPSSAFEDSGEYVSPRRFWREGSVPTVHRPENSESTEKSVRDTRFYGFYDDITNDYSKRLSKL